MLSRPQRSVRTGNKVCCQSSLDKLFLRDTSYWPRKLDFKSLPSRVLMFGCSLKTCRSKTGKSTNPPAPKATPPHDVASTNPPRCPLAKGPLLFVSLDAAIKSFFIELTERKIKHNYSPVVEGRRTLRISGITRIVSKGDNEKEFRRALVESAIRLGIVKLESS